MRDTERFTWYGLLGVVVLVPLVVGIVPFVGTPLSVNAFVQPKFAVFAIALAVALAAWALSSLARGSLFVGRSLIPLGVFAAAAAISGVFAQDRVLALFGDMEQGVGLLVLLMCCLSAFLVTQAARTSERFETLTSAVIWTAVAVAAVGLIQQIFIVDLLGLGAQLESDWMLERGFGTIGNPDTYAGFLVLPIVLALHRLRFADDTKGRVSWGVALIAMVASLIMSQTRAPLFGLVIGLVLYYAIRWVMGTFAGREAAQEAPQPKRGKKQSAKAQQPAASNGLIVAAVVGGAVLVGIIAAVALPDENRFLTRFTDPQTLLSLGGRGPLWRAAVEIASAHPVFGVGPDSFRLGWYPVRSVSDLALGSSLVVTDPHNIALWIAATLGVVGLLAAAFLLVAAFVTGFRLAPASRGARGVESGYEAWLAGAIALAIVMLASMTAGVMLLLLFVAIGVLLMPSLKQREIAGAGKTTLQGVALVVAGAFVVYGSLTIASQLVAVGARTPDATLNAQRAARASSLALWDSKLRQLRYETLVQSALDAAFTGAPDAATKVEQADIALKAAADAHPADFFYAYQRALLLIGAGEKLGDATTQAGIEAADSALAIYPQALSLRTGLATAYLTVGQPAKAVEALASVWEADPEFAPAGITYARALLAAGDTTTARAVAAKLSERFPDDPAVIELQKQVNE